MNKDYIDIDNDSVKNNLLEEYHSIYNVKKLIVKYIGNCVLPADYVRFCRINKDLDAVLSELDSVIADL